MKYLHSHPEYLALLRGVLEKPEDDAPRLILSDCLEENGEDERADFIRIQIKSNSSLTYGDVFKIDSKEATLLSSFGERWLGKWDYAEPNNFVWSRGFVSGLQLPVGNFMWHVGELFRRFPITKVQLTDRWPRRPGIEPRPDRFAWSDVSFDDSFHRLPPHLIFTLNGGEFLWRSDKVEFVFYETVNEAMTDASQACVAYGRRVAELPK